MVAYTGDLSFTGKASPEGGITGFLKEAATSEGTPIMTIKGTGHAYLADPIVLSPPVSTDPGATVAWSGTSPSVEVNKNLSDMIGQESGERFQMNFSGDSGFVVVQPREEL